MRLPAMLLCSPFLLAIGPVPQALPERESIVFACGFVVSPPNDLRGWRERADLVVRVRLESQVAFEVVRSSWSSDIVTSHEAVVLDLVKGHPRAVVAGAVQQLLQMGGRIRREDAFETQTWNGFPVMPIGTEWVLFLQWDSRLDGFTLFYGEHGAVQIAEEKIATFAGSLHREWNGRPADEFLQALGR